MNSFKINKLLDSIQIASTLHKDLTIVSFAVFLHEKNAWGELIAKLSLLGYAMEWG